MSTFGAWASQPGTAHHNAGAVVAGFVFVDLRAERCLAVLFSR